MSNDPHELPSIDLAALREVTGGLADDGKIVAALQSIQDTIKSLGSNNNTNNAWQQFLPFLLMAFGGGGGHVYAGSACGCGCGGRRRCCRR
jgi:hypothetical protein